MAELLLVREANGHFYADARVNGSPTRLLVDTGASALALTRADATRAGIGAGTATLTGRGAGGTVALQPATVARLTLGTFAADNLPAVVADELPVSLLGQDVLARFGSIRIEGDRMVLR